MGTIKKSIIVVALLMLIVASVSYSDIVSIDGGVVGDPTLKKNTYEYKEVIFISGEPIELIGTVTVPDIPEDKDSYSISYKYSLQNIEKSATLDRTIKYDVTKEVDDVNRQTVLNVEIPDTGGLTESITIGDDEYVLGGYSFSKSILYDNTPAVDYYSGTIYIKRVYYKNGDNISNEGRIVLESSTDNLIGYKHYWGAAETQITNHKVDYTPYEQTDTDVPLQGFITSSMSHLKKIGFQYLKTDPQNISFRGNYIKTGTVENLLQYSYDMPDFTDDNVNTFYRDDGEIDISSNLITDRESLKVPKYRDIGGHWAEDSIFLLGSLGIFKTDSQYFAPDSPITRVDFAVAIANAIKEIIPLTQTERVRLYREKEGHPYYDYNPNGIVEENALEKMLDTYNHVKFLKDSGITVGMGDTKFFYPETYIKRSEAINMIVKALGLENLAPAPPYKTMYLDDDDIPFWAKDSIYMANEIGLITGYDDGTIRPDNFVSRADAAVFIEKFINHIKDEISYDYREKIINRD